MNDLMIDLETLGTAVNAPILSIGACYFDRSSGKIGEKFHGKIDPSDALRYGRMDGSTFKWWMIQSDVARREVISGTLTSEIIFGKFSRFCRKHGRDVRVWGNGASFDISMLESAFPRILREPAPWKFWNSRDCRTIKDMANSAGLSYEGAISGVAHSALDDAVHQAEWVSWYWHRLTVSPTTADNGGLFE